MSLRNLPRATDSKAVRAPFLKAERLFDRSWNLNRDVKNLNDAQTNYPAADVKAKALLRDLKALKSELESAAAAAKTRRQSVERL
jgi:hypothetical protein